MSTPESPAFRRGEEVNGLSPSTVTRMRQGKALDADGLAALVAWLFPKRIPPWIAAVGDDAGEQAAVSVATAPRALND